MVLIAGSICNPRACALGRLPYCRKRSKPGHTRREVCGCVRSTADEGTRLVFRVLPLSETDVNNDVDISSVANDAAAHIPTPMFNAGSAAPLQSTNNAEITEAKKGQERLEAAVTSELLQLELGDDASELSSKVASKVEEVRTAASTKFTKLAEGQDQLQNQTAGIAKQLQSALIELEKLLADRLVAEQQAVQADLDLQQSVLQLEVATAERDAAIEQAQKLKTALQVWEAKNQRLASQLRAARQDVVELSESRSKLESRFFELYEKREMLERRVVDAEEMATQAQNRVQDLQVQVSELSHNLTGHSSEAEELSSQLAAAREDLQNAQAHQQHLSSLLSAAQQGAKTTEELLNVERQRMEALRAQVAADEHSKAQMQHQLEDLQGQLAQLHEQAAAAEHQSSAQLADSQRYTSRLRQQLQATTYQHDMISESNHKLMEQLEAAGREVKDLTQQLKEARLASQKGTSTSGSDGPVTDSKQDTTARALRAIDQERKTTAIQNQQLREQVSRLGTENSQLQSYQAELQQELEKMKQQQQLEAVNSWVATRETLMKAYSQRHEKRHSTMALVQFANKNKFWVPDHLRVRFLKAWMDREQQMYGADGFLGLGVCEKGEEVSVSSLWLSVATWESWALSAASRRSHLPDGIQQFVPEKGEEFGFPEDFIPFRDYKDAVIARYQ